MASWVVMDLPTIQSKNSIGRKDIAHWFSREDNGLIVVNKIRI